MRRSISVVMDGPAEAAFASPCGPEELGVKPCWRSNGMNTGDASTRNRDNSWYKTRVVFRLPRRLSHDDLTPTPPDAFNWLMGRPPIGVMGHRTLEDAWDFRYGRRSGLGCGRALPQEWLHWMGPAVDADEEPRRAV